jgi:hypothetical protein
MTIVPDGVSGGGITEGATWFCGEEAVGALLETIAAMFKTEPAEEVEEAEVERSEEVWLGEDV